MSFVGKRIVQAVGCRGLTHLKLKYPVCAIGRRNFADQRKKSYLSSLEWFYIPAGVGFGVICYIQIKHIWQRQRRKIEEHEADKADSYTFKPWQVQILKKLPTRTLSGIWGYISDCHLPMWLRSPLIHTYAKVFNCNLDEALVVDVRQYETFNSFFTRKLKPDARQVCSQSALVCPSDSTVLSCGVVSDHLELEQIKGVTYPLRQFVGPRHPLLRQIAMQTDSSSQSTTSSAESHSFSASCSTQAEPRYQTFFCSLYLGPGDYHWFHSPTEWVIEHRRHIPGHLFSVNPRALRSVNGIFNFNERVLVSGQWQHGTMLMAAIGAYNVGSIKLDFASEMDLTTNNFRQQESYSDRLYATGRGLKRGDVIGRFELGSSIVLVFTAPEDFEFKVAPGDKVQYGQPLGIVKNSGRLKIG